MFWICESKRFPKFYHILCFDVSAKQVTVLQLFSPKYKCIQNMNKIVWQWILKEKIQTFDRRGNFCHFKGETEILGIFIIALYFEINVMLMGIKA